MRGVHKVTRGYAELGLHRRGGGVGPGGGEGAAEALGAREVKPQGGEVMPTKQEGARTVGGEPGVEVSKGVGLVGEPQGGTGGAGWHSTAGMGIESPGM